MNSPHFLLVGNGPYSNRGCEAIVRGTMAILRKEFGENFRVTLGTFENSDVVADQAAHETDPLIKHVSLYWQKVPRLSPKWWRRQLNKLFYPELLEYDMLDRFCRDATCALQIGGDNYTLDYGRPRDHMKLDKYFWRRKIPVVLWGASVGPFEADSEFAPEIYDHLRAMQAIFVRESESYSYLKQHKIELNLHRMADPAFVMEPVKPSEDKVGLQISPGVVGINFSPLMAKYVTNGNMDAWSILAYEIVIKIVETTNRKVLLIPHVTWEHNNDHAFLHSVTDKCSEDLLSKVACLNGYLSAAEIKWVISRCAVFVGARTHSTIAAISSGVPTLSLAYSLKARGLNQDIFGTQKYCIQPAEISPDIIAERVIDLLFRRDAIAAQLENSLFKILEKAFHAGTIFRRIVESFRTR